MGFKTKVDYGTDNRQLKQLQFSETTLSGKTTFGVDDVWIPENFTGDTINIDALQYIRSRGLIVIDGSQQNGYVLTSDANGKASWQPVSGGTVSGNYLPLTGGTVSGDTIFTESLTIDSGLTLTDLFKFGVNPSDANYADIWAGGVTPTNLNYNWEVKLDGTENWFNIPTSGLMAFTENNDYTNAMWLRNNNLLVGYSFFDTIPTTKFNVKGDSTFLGSISGTSFVKTGGGSNEYLLADGGTSILADDFVPTSGGTFDGSVTFSGITSGSTPYYTEDFESGSMSGGTLSGFTTSGNTGWEIDSTTSSNGTKSIRSGNISDNQSSQLFYRFNNLYDITLFVFDHKLDAEECCDYLSIILDGVYIYINRDTTVPDNTWTEESFEIHGKGEHEIIFSYGKDTNTSHGGDSSWIDNIRLYEYGGTVFLNPLSVQGGVSISDATINHINTASDIDISTFGLPGFKVGSGAGDYTSLGQANTAVGRTNLINNTRGYYNAAYGRNNLKNNTSGYENTAIGSRCLEANTTGYSNVAIGRSCLFGANGAYNIAIGYNAGTSWTTGTHNISITNYNTGFGIRQGSNNIIIGNGGGGNGTNMSAATQTILLGYGATVGGSIINPTNSAAIGRSAVITESNQIVLGNTSARVIAPGLSIANIDAESTGKVLLTREYLEDYAPNKQQEIFSGYTLTSLDNNSTIWLSATTGTTGTTITVDDTLPDNFECSFYNDGPQDWDFSGGTGTLSIPDGNILIQDKVCTIIKKGSNNDYKLKGELE